MQRKLSVLLKTLIRIALWGGAYYLAAWFSLTQMLYPNGVAIAWPPIGIFIAAILLTPPRARPYLILTIFLADVAADMHTTVSWTMKVIYGILSTGDAVISAFILLRFVANPFNFNKAKNFLLYIFFSIVLCNGFFSLLVATATGYAQGSPFLTGFISSWVADGVGNLMVLPLIVSWSSFSRADLKQIKLKRAIEIMLLILILIISNTLIFPFSEKGLLFSFIINYLSFPFIIWAIFRFDMKAVTLVLMLLTLVVLFNLKRYIGLSSENYVNWNLVFFQLYIASISVISILISSVSQERNQVRNALMESEYKYRTVADYTYDWEYWADSKGDLLYMSPSVKKVTGYPAEAFFSNPGLIDEIVFPDDRKLWEKHIQDSHHHNNVETHNEVKLRIVSQDGTIHWIGHVCRQMLKNGKKLGTRVSNRDITLLVEAERKLLFNTVEVEERERSRYSRELHDGLGPLLSTIKMLLQNISESQDLDKIKQFAARSESSIKLAMRTMREVAYGLNPGKLKKMGYADAVNDFIENLSCIPGLVIDFRYNTKMRFGDYYETILYRITTELINNTLMHSHATSAVITFTCHQDCNNISLEYSDNGIGFDPELIRTKKGTGLENIHQRTEILGGNISIESSHGKGMRLYLEFPVIRLSSSGEIDGRHLF